MTIKQAVAGLLKEALLRREALATEVVEGVAEARPDILKSLTIRLIGQPGNIKSLVSLLADRPDFVEALLAFLATRPDTAKSLIPFLVRAHGPAALQALSENDRLSIVQQLWRDRRMDVLRVFNAEPGSGFRYVSSDQMKVVLGSGGQQFEGWLSTDINDLDIVAESSWRRLFLPASIDRIVAEHVFEHLTLAEVQQAFRHIRTFLKAGGRLRLAVPDAFHPSRFYYNLVKPGGWETPLEHKIFLDHEILTRLGTEAGLQVELLEYFDGTGVFHATSYDDRDGPIQRCARNSVGLDKSNPQVMTDFYASIPEHLRQQFTDRGMTYTSLIADLRKTE